MNYKKLSTGDFGAAVARLHKQLEQQSFEVAATEVKRNFFGPATRAAVREFQKQQGLEITGEVDEATAAALEEANAASGPSAAEMDSAPTSSESGEQKATSTVDEFLNVETPHKGTATTRPDTSSPKAPLRLSAQKKKRLENLTSGIREGKKKAKLEQLFSEAGGNFESVKARLETDKEFDDDSIRHLKFKHDIAELLEDQENWVATCVRDKHIHCLRDIALNYKKEDFKSLIRSAGIPEDAEGENEEESLEQCATRVCDRLFRMAPTAVIQRMAKDGELADGDPTLCRGVESFLNSNPDLDFRKTSVLEVLQKPDGLEPVPDDHREKVVEGLKQLQRIAVLSPKAEAVPALLKSNLTSAYAINEMPMERFVSLYADPLGGEDVARIVHRNAQDITLRNEEAYVALRQATLGAPVRMIHGDSATIDRRRAEVTAFVQQKNIPLNFEALFGSVDLCECAHCNSVYSPAAYLVELFQYLRNNNLDPYHPNTGEEGYSSTPLNKNPLDMFFRRRPDLGRLQLTCENTNTLIPYVDLVNEVMESFVWFQGRYETDTSNPKRAIIRTYNVEDQTSGELLAEPQNTNYFAYRKLSNTVYPVCKLPYHQPIDATRHYLDYLGTSRYELFDTFRADIPIEVDENASDAERERATRKQELEVQAVDRAIAAEFHHLTEEEYVILTKEGFHTKEWYELDEGTNLSISQYHDRIGLKPTWEYYGIDSETQMIEELKWVKPAQEQGIVGFLRRVDLKYLDLIELLKTRYINPNYLSGKDLAYMHSIRYGYRYLQRLVDDTQTDIKLKYQQLVALLQSDDRLDSDHFSQNFVECWVYKYFTKVGKIIVLEDGASCNCIEGRIRLYVINRGDDAPSHVDLYIEEDCRIYYYDSDPKIYVGYLDVLTGKLVFEEDFSSSVAIFHGEFVGRARGERGVVEDLTLYIDGQPFICANYQEKCDLSQTQLKHLDGTDLVTSEYDRIHRFIRLWCKLGWSIDEVDQAITGIGEATTKPSSRPTSLLASDRFVALLPSVDTSTEEELTEDPAPNATRFSASSRLAALLPSEDSGENGASPSRRSGEYLTARPKPEVNCQPEPISQVEQEITPYLIEQLVAVKKLLEITGLEVAKLLTYWTTIGIYGENPLYNRLFLKYNLVAEDNVFEADEYGIYLTEEACINDHLPILMASLKADVNMIETIIGLILLESLTQENGAECYPLTLDNVSNIYRHILLAKSLGIRVKELPGVLALLQNLAQPFGEPTETLKFYDLFARIEDSGFTPQELNYLLRDEDNQIRPLEPSLVNTFQLAISLRNTLLQIETDHADIARDDEATEELLRTKLSLLYDDSTVEEIVAFLQGTAVYADNTRRKFTANLPEADQEAITSFIQEQRKAEEKEPGGEFQTFLQRVQFSGTKGLQVTGILSEGDRDRVNALADSIESVDTRNKFLKATSKIFAQPERFFDDLLCPIFPQDCPPTENPDAITPRDILLAPDVLDVETPAQDSAFQKRAYFAKEFMPYLREELRQREVIQILASNLGLDLDITRVLIMEVIDTPEGEPLYQEIIRLSEQKDPDAETQRWQGFFVPEQEGKYTFFLTAEGEASLRFNNADLWQAPERTDEEELKHYQSQPIFLKANQTYPFLLAGYDEDENGNILDLCIKFNDQAPSKISNRVLFPALRTEAFRSAYIQLQKAAMVINGFSIKLEDIEFFQDHRHKFEDLDFNDFTLPQWLRLEAFYRLHQSLPQTQLSLVDFLRWTNRPDDAEEQPSLTAQVNALTGWEESEIYKMILPQYFNLPHREYFQDEKNLLKLQKTLQVAKKVGVGMGDLFQWGKPPANFSTSRKIAGGIRDAIRARYNQEDWEEVIKPTHDLLRNRQRDALIAYLLAQPVLMEWGVRDADSLFEFFLIDVQMDACMETSRIKQAISSVQLFVQRCFLGLEEKHGVSSTVLDHQRWEWTKYYRVWEANRKVFLYPENWIRPELRDVKSPFFEELESELLQNDVSNETVKSALTKYIVQVDEVANLQVVGQFIEGEEEARKLHVIGRTRNAPYFFYYRRYVFADRSWYPWEKIDGADIPNFDIEDEDGRLVKNGTFVTPVIWKDRLFIFFPQFMKKNWNSPLKNEMKIADSAEKSKMSDSVPLTYWEIKMGWSEYKEGKWSPKQVSSQVIYSMRDISRYTNYSEMPGREQKIIYAEHEFELLSEIDKFVFAPFVRKDNIYIQLYYLGTTFKVFERLVTGKPANSQPANGKPVNGKPVNEDNNESKDEENNNPVLSFQRIVFPPSVLPSLLPQSFIFDSNQVLIKDGGISNLTPSSGPWSDLLGFHRWNSIVGSVITPIQAVYPDNDPSDNLSVKFIEQNENNYIYFGGNGNSFQHGSVKDILGLLRKGEIKKIFICEPECKIPLSNHNYGSNDGISYHELKRPYAIYNWEFLFHSVSLLAENLTKSQRFEEAMQWWHCIFDPINVKGDIRNVWKFLPFRVAERKNILEKIFNDLDPNTPNDEISAWRDNPFQPHLIARDRISAYMKWVVMKYIDNLIAWGDHLFRQDTIETLNQATQLYVLAGHILGPRPEFIPKRGKIQPKSYNDLVNEWDAFSNAMVDLELIFPFSNQINTSGIFDGEEHYVNIYGFATTLYFCIPDNPKLLEYWDTVADRLFKIRHCLNIEGVFRKLNLFEPPIDPALLVQAAAQGLSISSVLNDLSTSMPNYRFNYLLQRALEVTSEVKSLGGALLSALEKKDGESLSILRAQHDTRIQNLMMEIREKQLEEAQKIKESLEENRKSPVYRLEYYQQLAGEEVSAPTSGENFSLLENSIPEVKEESGLKLISEEQEAVKKARQSINFQIAGGVIEGLVGILHLFPELNLDIKPIGIGAGLGFSGTNLGNALEALGRATQIASNITSAQSSAAANKASYRRQWIERIFQANLAGQEIKQIDKQITTQAIRIQLACQEIENHKIQVEQTEEVEEFIRRKYSNEQLYQWMSDRLKDLYRQAYSFAYDLAKKAEKVYRFEMGLSTSDFIKFGYWDSARDGFLAGEQLYLALKNLENAYVEKKPYDYEITKHVSLKQLNPLALIQLREEGVCEFSLPEENFDLDYPGHFKRRIKTVSISIPCVVGPYTSLNCTLRLRKHEYRNSKIAASASDYAKKLEEADERFVFNPIPTTAIAVSQGQNDSGVFELNFRDERYMPFEGAGAISTWRIELPQEFRHFDYQTISDVILHLRYTSCEGGELLKAAATENVRTIIEDAEGTPLKRLFSAKHEFPGEWHQFLHPEQENTPNILDMELGKERFPFYFRDKIINIDQIDFYLKIQEGESNNNLEVQLFTPDSDPEQPFATQTFEPGPTGLPQASFESLQFEVGDSDTWMLQTQSEDIPEIEEMFIICHYTVTNSP